MVATGKTGWDFGTGYKDFNRKTGAGKDNIEIKMKEEESLFWPTVQRFLKEYEKKKQERKPHQTPIPLPKEQVFIVRRQMPKMPRNGKR